MLNLLIRSRIATRRLLWIRTHIFAGAMSISARVRLPELACRAHFPPGLQPRRIKLRSASGLCALLSHVETLVNEPARNREEIGKAHARVVPFGGGSRWRGRGLWQCSL